MIKKLIDCNVGDYVRLWCIGTRCWDDTVVKIVDNKAILVKVKYSNNRLADFSSNTECRIENK